MPRPNAYGQACDHCGKPVAAQGGYLATVKGLGRYAVLHKSCYHETFGKDDKQHTPLGMTEKAKPDVSDCQEAYMPLPPGSVKVNIVNNPPDPGVIRQAVAAWANQLGKQSMIFKEQQMTLNTTKLIESRIFINGVDASTLSDDHIFQVIAKAEHDIKELEMIDNKPVKLIKKLDKARKSINKVLRYVDAR